MHEQKFKDLSSTCPISSERSVGLGIRGSSEARVLFPLGVRFSHWIFLSHVVKASDANIDIIAKFVQFVKNPSDL